MTHNVNYILHFSEYYAKSCDERLRGLESFSFTRFCRFPRSFADELTVSFGKASVFVSMKYNGKSYYAPPSRDGEVRNYLLSEISALGLFTAADRTEIAPHSFPDAPYVIARMRFSDGRELVREGEELTERNKKCIDGFLSRLAGLTEEYLI